MVGRSIPRLLRRSLWTSVAVSPADPILGLVAAFLEDPTPNKVNLAQGAYRTEEGLPLLLSAVRKAEERIVLRKASKEYLGIEGLPAFNAAAAKFALGPSSASLAEGRVASLQTLSGTGSLRVCGDMLREVAGVREVYLPSPSWGNHAKIFGTAGLQVKQYAYLNPAGTGLDFPAMHSDISKLTPGSVVLLHAAAHNPTGVDPTPEQWRELAQLFLAAKLVPLFDTAYQGFATGDCERDALALRAFEEAGLHPILCQSFAKNMGLYGERVGAIHVVTKTPAEAAAVLSNVKQRVIRPNYSSPPRHGAAIAAEVLTDAVLLGEWHAELLTMAQRIVGMRVALRAELERIGAGDGRDWSHVTNQIGMFAFTGLSARQVESLRKVEHVYLTSDGRMSLAGLAAKHVNYVAAGMARATKELP